MEVINPDNTKSNIDVNKLDDYLALQLEEQEKFIQFCKRYNLYVWGFTLDSKSQGGGFFNLPEGDDLKRDFIINMSKKIGELTSGEWVLVPRKFIESL